MDNKIIPVTTFLRNFGEYAKMLSSLDKLILTREGRPFAEVKASPEEKNKKLLSLSGAWDGKLFSGKIWDTPWKRKNRKDVISF